MVKTKKTKQSKIVALDSVDTKANKSVIVIGLVLIILVLGISYLSSESIESTTKQDIIIDADAFTISTSTGDSFLRYVQGTLLNETITVAQSAGLERQEQIVTIDWSDHANWTVVYSMRR